MNSPSPELHELGGQFSSRERFQLFSGETNFSLKFRKIWFSANTPLQTIITQATFVTDDQEKLLTIGRNFVAKHQGKSNRCLHDDELFHKIIPEAIQYTKNTRLYYEASQKGEKICRRKSPHYLVLFMLFDHETRTAQQILDQIRSWRDNPVSAESWQSALLKDANPSLAAIKRQLEDGVRGSADDTGPMVERVRKGVYRLISERKGRVEWCRCCLDIYLDWRDACEKTDMKLPRVGYRFFSTVERDPSTGKYRKSQYEPEFEQMRMKAPYNNDAFYRKFPQLKKGWFDPYNPDHIKVGDEEFFHGSASRRRIAAQQKEQRVDDTNISGGSNIEWLALVD